ncbi:unnamed protein product [Knipowitschia caucasica]
MLEPTTSPAPEALSQSQPESCPPGHTPKVFSQSQPESSPPGHTPKAFSQSLPESCPPGHAPKVFSQSQPESIPPGHIHNLNRHLQAPPTHSELANHSLALAHTENHSFQSDSWTKN